MRHTVEYTADRACGGRNLHHPRTPPQSLAATFGINISRALTYDLRIAVQVSSRTDRLSAVLARKVDHSLLQSQSIKKCRHYRHQQQIRSQNLLICYSAVLFP